MKIKMNEQLHDVEADISLSQLIRQFSLPEAGSVFAINDQIIAKNNWKQTILCDGDEIALFQVIAGG